MKKNNKKMVTMSKKRMNFGVSMITAGAMIEGATLMAIALDSFMNGAISDKVVKTVDAIQTKRAEIKMAKYREIVKDPDTGIFDLAPEDAGVKPMRKNPDVAEETIAATASEDDDAILSEVTDLADYTEACKIVGYEIGHETWKIWKANPNFSMEGLRVRYASK